MQIIDKLILTFLLIEIIGIIIIKISEKGFHKIRDAIIIICLIAGCNVGAIITLFIKIWLS